MDEHHPGQDPVLGINQRNDQLPAVMIQHADLHNLGGRPEVSDFDVRIG
jgi:hypothetical protein